MQIYLTNGGAFKGSLHIFVIGWIAVVIFPNFSNALLCYDCYSPVRDPKPPCLDPIYYAVKVVKCKELYNVCAKTFMTVVVKNKTSEIEGEIMARYCARAPVHHDKCVREASGNFISVNEFPPDSLLTAFPGSVNITGVPLEELKFRRLTTCRCQDDKCNSEKGHTIPESGPDVGGGQGQGGGGNSEGTHFRHSIVYFVFLAITCRIIG